MVTAKTKATASTFATKLTGGRVYSVLKNVEFGADAAIKTLMLRDPTGTHTFGGRYKDPLTNTASWTSAMLNSLE